MEGGLRKPPRTITIITMGAVHTATRCAPSRVLLGSCNLMCDMYSVPAFRSGANCKSANSAPAGFFAGCNGLRRTLRPLLLTSCRFAFGSARLC